MLPLLRQSATPTTMLHLAAAALAALPLAVAFQGTVPLVVRSSIP